MILPTHHTACFPSHRPPRNVVWYWVGAYIYMAKKKKKIIIIIAYDTSVAGPRDAKDAPALGSNSSIFMQFLTKKLAN